MIEKISLYLAEKIISESNSQDHSYADIEVIEYGIECIINTSIPILFFLPFSLATNIFWEFILWIITFLTIRNFVGGYHASSHLKCIIFSIIFGIFSLYCIQSFTFLTLGYKLIGIALTFLNHVIGSPILSIETANNNLMKLKSIICILITSIAIIIFNYINFLSSNAIFIGLIGAEVLYILEKVKRRRTLYLLQKA